MDDTWVGEGGSQFVSSRISVHIAHRWDKLSQSLGVSTKTPMIHEEYASLPDLEAVTPDQEGDTAVLYDGSKESLVSSPVTLQPFRP